MLSHKGVVCKCSSGGVGMLLLGLPSSSASITVRIWQRKRGSEKSIRQLAAAIWSCTVCLRRHRILTEPYGSTKISAEVHTWPADLQAESGRTQDLRRGKRQSSWYPWRVTEEPRPSLAWLRPQTSRQTSQNPQMHGYIRVCGLHACPPACLHGMRIHTYIHTVTYLPTYLTYLHTYIQTHTHTHAVGSVLVRVHVHACRHVRMDGVLRSSAEVDVLWQAATCDLRLRLKESAQLEDVAVQPSLNSAEARPLSRRSRSFVPKLLLAKLASASPEGSDCKMSFCLGERRNAGKESHQIP